MEIQKRFHSISFIQWINSINAVPKKEKEKEEHGEGGEEGEGKEREGEESYKVVYGLCFLILPVFQIKKFGYVSFLFDCYTGRDEKNDISCLFYFLLIGKKHNFNYWSFSNPFLN